MTGREILLNSMKHIASYEGGKLIVPYTLGFDCPVLQERVNKHYGGSWWGQTRQFMHTPFYVNTTREEPIEGRANYARDVFGSIWFITRISLSTICKGIRLAEDR